MADSLKLYLANQREHHCKMTFHDEYLAMLTKHQIEFDPRYAFEKKIVA